MPRVRRRLASVLFLTALLWLPAMTGAPVVRAAGTCTAWGSSRIPPSTLQVLRTSGPSSGTVQTVDFKTYVRVVLAAEWPASWPSAALESGAVAVKQYAWYYIAHWRGGSATGGCYDVVDNNNDQVYWPESKSPSASQVAAVDATWNETITKGGAMFLTGYRSGNDVACGADVNGAQIFQHSARNCAAAGMTRDDILKLYYGPGLSIQTPAAQPSAVFLTPGFGQQTTAGSSVAATWTEETSGSTTVTSRNLALQMAAPINGGCGGDRWLPSTAGWSSTGASPQTANGLQAGYCYRFVVGLTDSTAATAYSISGAVIPDPSAPVASFTSPADGTISAFSGGLLAATWNETSAPGTSILSRLVTEQYASQPVAGSCAGAQWQNGAQTTTGSGSQFWLDHFNCYRWVVSLTDSAGHTGTWVSGILVEPAP